MTIKNETIYDKELLNDAGKLLTRKYIYIVGSVILIFIVMAFVNGAVLKSSIATVVIPIIGIIFVLIMGILRVVKYKKMLYQRLLTVNHEDKISCSYIIDKEKIEATYVNGTNTLYHKDIVKIQESEKIYLIIYSGGLFIIISKNGFEDPALCDLKKFLI